MNRDEFKGLMAGDKIIFKPKYPAYTVGKSYTILVSNVGKLIIDDNRVGRYLSHFDNYENFEREV